MTIGFVSTGQTASLDTTDEFKSAQVAADYINDYKGGIGGEKIKLLTCGDEGTAAGGQNCANQMISAKVPVVVAGTPSQFNFTPDFQSAGIPYFDEAGASPPATTSPDTYLVTNAVAITGPGPAALAKENGVTSTVILSYDDPTLIGGLNAEAPLFKANGSSLAVIPVPLSAPDLTPQVTVALQHNPGLILLLATPTQCDGLLDALNSLSYKGITVVNANCITSTTNSTVTGGLKGVYEITSISTAPTDPDFMTFLAAKAKYAPSLGVSGYSTIGWQVMSAFAAAMGSLQGPLTSASVTAALASMSPTHLPLGGGIMFQCNRKQVTSAPSICTDQALQAQFAADGTLGSFKLLTVGG